MPAGVFAPTPMFSVAEPPDCTVDGETVAVVPDGVPLTDSEMLAAGPETIAVDTVAVVDAPAWTVPADGFSASE